jgi:hypothetical protein
MAFTKLNVAASNLVDESLLLLDHLGMLSPSAAMDEFHQAFLLFPHCVLLHVPKQPAEAKFESRRLGSFAHSPI